VACCSPTLFPGQQCLACNQAWCISRMPACQVTACRFLQYAYRLPCASAGCVLHDILLYYSSWGLQVLYICTCCLLAYCKGAVLCSLCHFALEVSAHLLLWGCSAGLLVNVCCSPCNKLTYASELHHVWQASGMHACGWAWEQLLAMHACVGVWQLPALHACVKVWQRSGLHSCGLAQCVCMGRSVAHTSLACRSTCSDHSMTA
jgi:hypothetical protein